MAWTLTSQQWCVRDPMHVLSPIAGRSARLLLQRAARNQNFGSHLYKLRTPGWKVQSWGPALKASHAGMATCPRSTATGFPTPLWARPLLRRLRASAGIVPLLPLVMSALSTDTFLTLIPRLVRCFSGKQDFVQSVPPLCTSPGHGSAIGAPPDAPHPQHSSTELSNRRHEHCMFQVKQFTWH